MLTPRFSKSIINALKKNSMLPVFHKKCEKCSSEYYTIVEWRERCGYCSISSKAIYGIHARTRPVTMCATIADFIVKFGHQPSPNHAFLMDKKTRIYAWKLRPEKGTNPYEGIQETAYGTYTICFNNKYISSHKTREEAKQARDAFLATLPQCKARIIKKF